MIPLLNDIIIIFGLAVGILLVCHRLGIPPIVGFLLTGALAGPHGLGLIHAVHEVEMLAEMGVVLLLFTIGIEFSFQKLLEIKKAVLGGGTLQVVLTVAAVALLAWWSGLDFREAVFFGFLFSLSSTAIVLSVLQQRAEIDSPHGRTALGVLIFQDLAIVPMILFTPLLAGNGMGEQFSLPRALGGVAVVGLVVAGSLRLLPRLLHVIARTRSRELFLLAIVAICLTIAWLTASVGLSLALGAFMAGLLISESEYGQHALGNIIPFKDVFTSLFFVSVGMLLDLGFFFHQPLTILAVTLAVLLAKTGLTSAVVLLLGLPLRTALLAGLAVCQVGEFSFILSRTGLEWGLIQDHYQFFLAVSVLTMAASPFIMTAAPRLAELVLRLPVPARLGAGLADDRPGMAERLNDHLVIIGYGATGRNVSRTAHLAGIPYVIIEMSPDTVRKARDLEEPIFYGDAVHEPVLERARLAAARVAVVAINDPAAVRRIIEKIKRIAPQVHLVVRTRYIQEMEELLALGAEEVIPEEFETSVEIFTRVLSKYLVPRDDIEQLVSQIRADGYQMFRSLSGKSASIADLRLHFPDMEISTMRLSEAAPLVGRSLADIGLRKNYGVTVLALHRRGRTLANPPAEESLAVDDVLYVLGRPADMAGAKHLFG